MKKKVVLCVDDEKIVLKSLESQLVKLLAGENGDAIGNKKLALDGLENVLDSSLDDKYDIELAESGEEAIEIITELHEESDSLALVISDYIMPQMKGDELLIKTSESFPDAKLIMLTGQADVEGISNVTNKSKLYRYIAKPWEKNDLLLTTKEALKSYEQDIRLREHNIILEQTVKVRTKELNEKNEKLVQLNQEKNNFLGMVSHDLRNPLNGISGYTNIILEEFQDLKDEEIQNYLGNIVDCSQQMLGLISNLLDVNAIESGNRKLSFEKFDLIAPLQSTINNFMNSAKEKEINLIYTPFEGECIVFGDVNTSKQILENLISNAIKYSPLNNNVYVNVHKIDGTVRCEIKDEGPGLNEDDKKQLFGKFARLSAQPTADESSTGLGLFIVKKLIEEMNGKVWCESEYGKGASFIIEFN